MSVKPIMKKVLFLSQKAESATSADKQVAIDLLDTLQAHKDGCVGMAANMIGVNKAIIAVNMGMMNVIMFNPKIVKKAGAFETQEGCLSLSGVRKCTRYREIEVTYQDMNFKTQRQKFSGWIAQIIQHEVDHLSGIII
ncbi:MAG: peptide deformylase [Clostridiales bacterium]|nr:peptide deformylase [Clostridiales bacterium]